jgi:phosphatidylglycerophosphate synthase
LGRRSYLRGDHKCGTGARGLSRYRADRLSPADWVTLARATLAVGVAALVADSFDRPAQVTMLVSLAAVALALDAVDGWVARRTRTTATLGAHFDAEVDAFLILVLSVYVARSGAAWVLAIGAARYAFLAAGWLLPWMREPLPPRHWRKVVAATQGVVLAVAAATLLPPAPTEAALVVALALLAESFGRDVWWLWSNRRGTHFAVAVGTDRGTGLADTTAPGTGPADATRPGPGPGRGRARKSIPLVLTVSRRSARVGRPRRSGPAERSHADRLREAPPRGSRAHRPGRRPTPHPRAASWLDSSDRFSVWWSS